MNKQLLLRTLRVQTDTLRTERMQQFIITEVTKKGYRIWNDRGNLYVVKGELNNDNFKFYPCVVAHTDTVHKIVPKEEFKVVCTGSLVYAINPVRAKMTGVGGDDKVGVYLALDLLDKLDVCKAAFFRDEEFGCIGSSEADLSFFDDCAFILEADRKGNRDFVSQIMGTVLFGKKFSTAIAPYLDAFQYAEYTQGGMTDVYELKEAGVDIAVSNLSCGYYNPHYDDEMVNIEDVENTGNLMLALFENLCYRQWKHKATHLGNRHWNNQFATATVSSGPLSYKSWKQGQNFKGVVTKVMEPVDDRTRLYEEIQQTDAASAYGNDDCGGAMCPRCEDNGFLHWDYPADEFFCTLCQEYIGPVAPEFQNSVPIDVPLPRTVHTVEVERHLASEAKRVKLKG